MSKRPPQVSALCVLKRFLSYQEFWEAEGSWHPSEGISSCPWEVLSSLGIKGAVGLFLKTKQALNWCVQRVGRLPCHQYKCAGIGVQMATANLQAYWNLPSHVIHSNSWKLPNFFLCCYFYFEWERGKERMNSTRCRHLLCKIILCSSNSTQRWIHALRWHRCMVCIHKRVVKLIPNRTSVFHLGENALGSCLCTGCIFRIMMAMPHLPCSLPKTKISSNFS